MYSNGTGAQGKLWDDHALRSKVMFEEADVEIIYYGETIDE